jgi:translation initiation factor IF-2
MPIIVKSDVQGSAEVLADTLTKLSDEKVRIRIISSGVGAITESDVLLASASNAIIIGFNVQPDRNARQWSSAKGGRPSPLGHHAVTDEIRRPWRACRPTFKEVRLGSAEVREVFKVPKIGAIAGCMVTEGTISRKGDARAAAARQRRGARGQIAGLRRFKDDVSEVKSGFECGISLEVQRHQGR